MKKDSLLQPTSYNLQARKGFTLIEVLIVVGIIGLLASVVLSGLGSVRSRGRDARRAADLRQVQQGLELFYTRTQAYPHITTGSWAELRAALKGEDIGITNISNDPLCKDDDDGDCENYQYFSNRDEYVLQALLEDKLSPIAKGAFGTADDEDFLGSRCGDEVGDRIYYCIKF